MTRRLSRPHIEDTHMAMRYLTGKLSPEETAEFEEFCIEHPDVAGEVELERRLRDGLRALDDDSGIGRIKKVASPLWRVRFALAASVLVVLAIGYAVFLTLESQDAQRIYATAQDVPGFEVGQSTPHIALIRLRGTDPIVYVRNEDRALALHLTAMPDALQSIAVYHVPQEARPQRIAMAKSVRATSSGSIAVYLSSAKLAPGHYAVVLHSTAPGPRTPPEEFGFELRRR